MPKRLKEEMGDILRELRPHAIWDAVKLVGLGVLAMLGVALTAILQRIRGVPPDMLGILILGGTWLLIVFAAYAFGKLRRNRAPAVEPESRLTGEAGGPIVEILRPLDLGKVGWHRVVSGKVDPPNTAVQVLVQSPNGAWYLQSTEVNGSLWTSNSQFGEKNRSGGSYKIVAVHGQTLSEEKYQALDDAWIRSQIITVNRNSDNDIIDCPDTQLHQTRIADKHEIRKLVKVGFVRCDPHLNITGDERQFVDLRICILNLSLREVSVKSVSGEITFTKTPYEETIKLEGALKLEKTEKALNLPFRSEGWLTVRQYVPEYQVAFVESAPKESMFYFHHLTITVSGEGFDPVELDLPAQVQKGISWNAQDVASQFLFARFAEEQRKALESKQPGVEFEISTMIRNSTVLLTDPGDTEDWRDAVAFLLEAKLFIRFYNDAPLAVRIYGLRLSILNDAAGKEWPLTLHIMPPNFRRPNAQENEYFQGLMIPGNELTDWYFFQFWMDVPKDCALSVDDNCYLRVTMDVGKQNTEIVDLIVPWKGARKREVSVQNRNPKTQINCL